ncbi:hypothetical protein MNBD_PLANCTO02-1538 [hydrothermal vent metagenome]|uniref:SAF domain-containing protein n=1 Tax=hydrothermal vent metagenome TaxID=652676 RepID=A0A3B1DSJ0_9ZZZZ
MLFFVKRLLTAPVIYTLVFAATVSFAKATEIRFQPKVNVDTSMVKLGEIAVIQGLNDQESSQLEEIILMPGPTPGNTIRIDFQMIRSRLRALGINLSDVRFSGSSVVLVTRTGGASKKEMRLGAKNPRATLLTQSKAKQLLVNAMQQYLRGKGVLLSSLKVEIHLEAKDASLVLSGKLSGYKIEGGTTPWEKRQQFVAKFQDLREDVHQVRFVAWVVPKPQVLATRFALPRGHIIKPADLVMKQIEDENAPKVRYEEIVGTETTRPIRQNQPITLQDVRSVPLVRSNDIVTVTSNVGGILVRRQMKSRGMGSRGETITLVSLDGRQSIQARVTAFHEAEVAGAAPRRSKYGEASGSRIEFRKPVAASNQPRVTGKYQSPLSYKSQGGSGIMQTGYQRQTKSNQSPRPQHQRPAHISRGRFLPSKYQPRPLPKEPQNRTNKQYFRGR